MADVDSVWKLTLWRELSNFFRAYLVEDGVFLFMVSCKEVGFGVYKIRKFECEDFKLSFHLFNDSSLVAARSLSSSDG